MGTDERIEPSIYEEIRKKDKETLKTMIQVSGFDEIVTLLREIKEEEDL
jgi:hypothetical protein